MIGLLSLMIEGHEGSDSVLNRIVIVSQATLFTEPRKGLVMLQPSNCRHGRNSTSPMRSALFIAIMDAIYEERRSHGLLSWGSNNAKCLVDVSIYCYVR